LIDYPYYCGEREDGMKLVTLETAVQLEEDGDTAISVEIGDGQIGGGVIKLEGTEICKTPVENHPLGSGSQLKGKTLLAKTIVSDENPHTNKTSVTYYFKQGEKEQKFVSKAEVENDGDVIGYWAKFSITL
jgi:hypothetical protein